VSRRTAPTLLPALLLALVAGLVAASLRPLGAAPRVEEDVAEASDLELVDRVVAVVDEDPILLSDVERVIGLRLVGARPDESRPALERRVLDGLIEQRLRLHEIARFGFEEVPLEDVEKQFENLRSQFPDEASFRAELDRLGLDEAAVRQVLARQLSILAYVEERLGPRVFVGVDDIRHYYEETLTPELRKQGKPVPPLDDVREQIRAVLRESRLNDEIDRWTDELRKRADVVDLLDAPARPLPPVVDTVAPQSPG
jgi:peptidyl-prolyl cis-trans isomerase SurA